MVFSTITFLFFFFPIFLAGYFILPVRLRDLWLLIASILFYYSGEPRFVIIMIFSIIWNYISGVVSGYLRSKKAWAGKMFLVLSIVANLSMLFYFKYFNFIANIINSVFHVDFSNPDILLPIGISFFTFQGMSYAIDVYRGTVEPQKNILKLGEYISMFPQLVAGPIVRYADIEEQLTHRTTNLENFCQGSCRFVVGLAKKVIIANTVALPADKIFALSPADMSTSTAWLGILCYTIQIYFDFSGYSDMAIGMGKMIGFDFAENFKLPYISKSITEFWRRWHISLSSWFRDYLYIPLGGSRKGNVYCHLLIVFLVTGLWHGASMTFVIWGLWHGIFVMAERFYRNHVHGNREGILPGPVKSFLQSFYTLGIVMTGWVFFRSDSLSYALSYIKRLFLSPSSAPALSTSYFVNNFTVIILIAAVVISFGGFQKLWERLKRKYADNGSKWPLVAERIGIISLLLVSAVMVMTSAYNPFIYFRF